VDSASSSTGEEELRGVGVQVELVVGGYDFKAVLDNVLAEDGGSSFFIGIAEPMCPWVYTGHGSSRGRGEHFFTFLVFQDKGEGWDVIIIGDFCCGPRVVGGESGNGHFCP
jgi:hypothetical protein